MKKAAKSLIVRILGWQVRRLYKKHDFKVVAVVGSIGKTSTKLAIARVLSESKRVRYQDGNYNDIVSVPLIFFDQSLPSLVNPFAWAKVILKNETYIRGTYPYDVVVVELGTDGPGQIAAFKQYIRADIAVVTALTPEHMEYFENLQAVADEELSVSGYAKHLFMSIDMCPKELTQAYSGTFLSYSLHAPASYQLKTSTRTKDGTSFTIHKNNDEWLQAQTDSFSEAQLYSLLAAAGVADYLEINKDAVAAGLGRIIPVAGRMQRLQGVDGSVIIDDSYNASPDAVAAALQTVYSLDAPQKIALLGNMNELGKYSEQAHRDIGALCDPKKLDVVVTLGKDANEFLAAAAEKNGCVVVRTQSPYEAGQKILAALKPGALVLIKGSQNGVFAEEAIKPLLADKTDASKLVRQSKHWMQVKQQMFAK